MLIFKLSSIDINYSDKMTIRFSEVTVGLRSPYRKNCCGACGEIVKPLPSCMVVFTLWSNLSG